MQTLHWPTMFEGHTRTPNTERTSVCPSQMTSAGHVQACEGVEALVLGGTDSVLAAMESYTKRAWVLRAWQDVFVDLVQGQLQHLFFSLLSRAQPPVLCIITRHGTSKGGHGTSIRMSEPFYSDFAESKGGIRQITAGHPRTRRTCLNDASDNSDRSPRNSTDFRVVQLWCCACSLFRTSRPPGRTGAAPCTFLHRHCHGALHGLFRQWAMDGRPA